MTEMVRFETNVMHDERTGPVGDSYQPFGGSERAY